MGTGTQNNSVGEPMQIRLNVKNTFIDANDDDDELDNGTFEEALRRMVSEPIPTRQYSGNAALQRSIGVVREEKGEEEEEETPATSSSVHAAAVRIAAASQSAPGQEPSVVVKNTFIDIANPLEDDGFEAGLQEILRARQQSEPVFQRQQSDWMQLQMAAAAQAQAGPEEQANPVIESMLGGMMDLTNLRKDLPEEPETEIEPQMQAAEHDWTNYFTQPQGLMDFSGAFSPESLMYPQQEFFPGGVQGLMDQQKAAAERTHNGPPIPPEWSNIYTVMMRNLPNRYTQRMLLDEICQGGFMGTFDFLYLPIDPDTNANKGYGFINFLDPSHAWQFKCTYEGKQMSRFNSSKFVSVSPAALQGLEANHAHYSTSRCSRGDPAARPLFLREPQQTMAVRPGGGRGSRRGGRRRLQDVSLVDIAARNAKAQAQGKPEAKGLPKGQMFGLGKTAPASQSSAKGSQGSAPVEDDNQAKFCPFCGGACKPEFRFCQFCGSCLDVLRKL